MTKLRYRRTGGEIPKLKVRWEGTYMNPQDISFSFSQCRLWFNSGLDFLLSNSASYDIVSGSQFSMIGLCIKVNVADYILDVTWL